MNDLGFRASYFVGALALVACGSGTATDFLTPDRGGAGSGASGGAQPGGIGGAAAAPQGGSAGATPGGGSGTGPGGSGAGGNAANAGQGQGGAAAGGSGGTGSGSFACGSLLCVRGGQWCRRSMPDGPGGPTQLMCQPFPDSCQAIDCSCVCDPPRASPCGPGNSCACSVEDGGITVVCDDN